MTQGMFAQALRKEAALSGTFMKGRSLTLNGAVLSFEDSGSRFSKIVTISRARCAARAATCTRRDVALDMDEHEVIDYDCDCPSRLSVIPACASTLSPRLWRIWMPAAPSPSKVCARRFARLRRSRNSPRATRPKRRPSIPTFPFHHPSPRVPASWRRLRSFGRAHG